MLSLLWLLHFTTKTEPANYRPTDQTTLPPNKSSLKNQKPWSPQSPSSIGILPPKNAFSRNDRKKILWKQKNFFSSSNKNNISQMKWNQFLHFLIFLCRNRHNEKHYLIKKSIFKMTQNKWQWIPGKKHLNFHRRYYFFFCFHLQWIFVTEKNFHLIHTSASTFFFHLLGCDMGHHHQYSSHL